MVSVNNVDALFDIATAMSQQHAHPYVVRLSEGHPEWHQDEMSWCWHFDDKRDASLCVIDILNRLEAEGLRPEDGEGEVYSQEADRITWHLQDCYTVMLLEGARAAA